MQHLYKTHPGLKPSDFLILSSDGSKGSENTHFPQWEDLFSSKPQREQPEEPEHLCQSSAQKPFLLRRHTIFKNIKLMWRRIRADLLC